MRILLTSLVLFLSGCAGIPFYDDTAQAWLGCQGTQCDQLMGKAQSWLTQSRYRIVANTPTEIKTESPEPRNIDFPTYTVTRKTHKDGFPIIHVHAEMQSTLMGSYFSPAPPVNQLFYYLLAERNKTNK